MQHEKEKTSRENQDQQTKTRSKDKKKSNNSVLSLSRSIRSTIIKFSNQEIDCFHHSASMDHFKIYQEQKIKRGQKVQNRNIRVKKQKKSLFVVSGFYHSAPWKKA